MLDLMDDGAYAGLTARATQFAGELETVLTTALSAAGVHDDAGVPLVASVPVVGPLVGIFFLPEGAPPVTEYDGSQQSAATRLYARLFRAMLDRGVALAPGPYEIAFPSMAHGPAEYSRALEVAEEAMGEAARAAVSDPVS